jgi:hypothetical protein
MQNPKLVKDVSEEFGLDDGNQSIMEIVSN